MHDDTDDFKELYARLETLVNDFTQHTNEQIGSEGVPVAHVLLIGCDGYKAEDTGTRMFPANGFQAGWKTAGLLSEAISIIDNAGVEED